VRLVRPKGHVANIGMHGAPATLHLADIWIKELIITIGLVDTYADRLVASHERTKTPASK
jgi:alcohol dehydrogenase